MIVSNIKEALRILKRYETVKQVTIDTETRGEIVNGIEYSALILNRARLLTFQMCALDEKKYVFVSNEKGKQFLDFASVLPAVKKILENPRILKIYHNGNYDINVFLNYGISSVNNYCTMLAGACYDENMGNSLKDRAVLVGMLLKKTKTIDFDNIEELSRYGAEDIAATEALHEYYSGGRTVKIVGSTRSKSICLTRLKGARKLFFEKQEMPLLNIIIRMERRGLRIDLPRLRKVDKKIEADMSASLKRIYNFAGEPFNVGSTKQLSEVLFNRLSLTAPEDCVTAKGAPSTNARTLFYMKGSHPIIEELLMYRQTSKLREVYTNEKTGLPYYCDDDGFIHASMNGCGARTFRLAISQPNLSTMPNKKDNYGIRECVIAPDGRKVAVYDYKQIEVCMQAVGSQDEIMVSELNKKDGDIYLRTAKEFGSPDPIKERGLYKVMVLALQYGMGPWTLADNLTQQGYNVSKTEARKWIQRYFYIYNGIPRMWYRLFQEHLKKGYADTLLGRPRCIPNFETVFSLNSGKLGLNQTERELVNNFCQGSTADWVKQGMLRIENHAVTTKYGYEQVLQVHDEVFGTVPEEDGEEIFAEVKMLAEKTPEKPFAPILPIVVPIRVEGGLGNTWREAK